MFTALLTGAAILSIPSSEVRGVWMTTTANDAIATPANTAASMKRLREIGFNRVYVETWKNGHTQFPSETLKKTIGVERHPALKDGRDLLQETLTEARKNGMQYIAWFEYGFMAAHEGTDNELLQQKRDWMTTTRDGSLISKQNEFVWMNPMRPECQRFLLDLVKEAVRKYDLDGVQLDDRIAWPTSMGYDPYTLAVYANEHGGALPPNNDKDPAWVAWRAKKVTEFARIFYKELKAIKPNLLVSISPAVYPWSLENYACDYPAWNKEGLMEEYVPQVYRSSYASFASEWMRQLSSNVGKEDKVLAGIMIDQPGRNVPWEDIRKKLDLVKASGRGHVFWYSKGVLNAYPEELKAYYSQR